jgi:methionyl-tRNA formyltransferase
MNLAFVNFVKWIKNMNIGICAAGYVGYTLLKYVIRQKQKIDFVITIDYKRDQVWTPRINLLCLMKEIPCYDFDVNSQECLDLIKKQHIDMMFLLWFPTIVKKHIIDAVKIGIVNTHSSYLPWNRGRHPYYWSFVENTPIGVTLHFIDKFIDRGTILFQQEIKKTIDMSGKKLYNMINREMISFFKRHYKDILNNNYVVKQQDNTNCSFHLAKDLEVHSCIDLEKMYKAKDLINIIRARTFGKGKKASYFMHNGKRYNLNISIEEDKE